MPYVTLITSDIVLAQRIEQSLESVGMEVHCAECAMSGLMWAREGQSDLIVCDEVLDDITALDLLEVKRSDPGLADLPVIVIGLTPMRSRDYYEAGCDDFVLLPANIDELSHKVRAVLRRSVAKGVSGNFSHISILEFIQTLVNAGRDGRLDVDCGTVFGTLYFRNGHVFSAQCSDLSGEPAFLELLRVAQKGGEFNFSAHVNFDGVEDNIAKRTDHLLLGLANILDEQG